MKLTHRSKFLIGATIALIIMDTYDMSCKGYNVDEMLSIVGFLFASILSIKDDLN